MEEKAGVATEPSNFDLALQLSELKGQLMALTQATTLQIQGISTTVNDSVADRRELHREVEDLKRWRARIGGVASIAGLLGLYAALHQAGVIH